MIKSPVPPQLIYRRVLSLVGQVGCMTIIIVMAAGFGGRWLDAHFNTGRNITLWLILGSFPLTLLLMYGLVRLSIRSLPKDDKVEGVVEPSLDGNKKEGING